MSAQMHWRVFPQEGLHTELKEQIAATKNALVEVAKSV